MTISNTRPVSPSQDYVALRLSIFKQLEGDEPQVYFDTAAAANPTIGIGLNLNDDGVLGRLLTAIGVTGQADRAALRSILHDPQILGLPPGVNPGQRTYRMRAALDLYLSQHPGAATVTTFTMTPTLRESTFNLEADLRENAIVGIADDTFEMLAVLSASYNHTYGSGLKAAIAADDRAEAWFQLRYGWDNTKVGTAGAPALAKRHFAEAALFGLYDTDGISPDEARKVFRMLNVHRSRITDYESLYATAAIAAANGDLSAGFMGSAFAAPQSKTLLNELDAARSEFAADLKSQYAGLVGTPIDAIVATNIFFGGPLNSVRKDGQGNEIASDDLLVGDVSGDTIDAGAGDDFLIGGTGNDHLRGGAGNDVYAFKFGDGQDEIVDADGLGSIFVGATKLTGANARRVSGTAIYTKWQADVGGQTVTYLLGNLCAGGCAEAE